MTLATAYWCVLIAAALPYLWVAIAKASGERYNNRDPRAWQARQDNPRSQRANAAQLNSFEAFAPFATGVILAQLAGVAHERIAWLAVVFIVFRVLHGLLYIANQHMLRTLAWTGGFVCVLWLLAQAALRMTAAA
ncbi:MAPEG family protein [Lysobacter cavernae]|uniref:MAPEG family protein n=1 Tax=Lysobacter cavernae TaxID=1685901 RepID=A0ABV7RR04_9GAMM